MIQRLILMVGTFLVLAGCAGGPQEHRFTVADSGKTVTVIAGDTVVIELAGNPTTGYAWAQTAVDIAILKPTADEPEYTSESTGMVGSPGTFIFRWTAEAPGTTTIELGYRRPWETDTAPIETYSLTVDVR